MNSRVWDWRGPGLRIALVSGAILLTACGTAGGREPLAAVSNPSAATVTGPDAARPRPELQAHDRDEPAPDQAEPTGEPPAGMADPEEPAGKARGAERDPEGDVERGMSEARAGRLAEALPHFRAALAAAPDHRMALEGAVACAVGLDDHELAVQLLEQMAKYHPARGAGLASVLAGERVLRAAQRAHERQRAGDLPGALGELRGIQALVPACPLYLTELGLFELTAGDSRGEATLHRALEVRCEGETLSAGAIATVHEVIGVAALKEHRWSAAEAEFRAAARLVKKDAPRRRSIDENLRVATSQGRSGKVLEWSWADVRTELHESLVRPHISEPRASADAERADASTRSKPNAPVQAAAAAPTKIKPAGDYHCDIYCGSGIISYGQRVRVDLVTATSAREAERKLWDLYGSSGACTRHFGRKGSDCLSIDCHSR